MGEGFGEGNGLDEGKVFGVEEVELGVGVGVGLPVGRREGDGLADGVDVGVATEVGWIVGCKNDRSDVIAI